MNKYIVDGIVQKPYFKLILETIFQTDTRNHILWLGPPIELTGDVFILYRGRYHFIFRILAVFEH